MANAKISRRNSPETAALNDLLATMNNPAIQGVVVPPGVDTKVVEPTQVHRPAPPETVPFSGGPAVVEPEAAALRADVKELNAARKQTQADLEAINMPPVIDPALIEDKKPEPLLKPAYIAQPENRARVNKFFFTGRLKSGKDFAATAAGAKIIGFADPLYAIASYYFHLEINATEGKDIPGVREFLQTIGQWGRGVVSEKYPLNVGRAIFISQILSGGPKGFFGFPEVAWATYGRHNDIWLDAAIIRANEYIAANADARVAITNCRFDHEFKRLQADGWQHWHSLCSPKTWAARLLAEKLTPESAAVRDLSEQLAANLDSNVVKQLSAQKDGPKLRAIWNDRDTACPSSRLHSVESFLASIGGAA